MRVYDGVNPVVGDSQDFAQCGDNRSVVMDKLNFYPLPLVYRCGGFDGAAADGNIHNFSGIPPFFDDRFFGLGVGKNKIKTGINNDLAAAETAGGEPFDLA